MKKLLAGTVLGGLTVFVWGTISWMALPWHHHTLKTFTNEAAVAQVVSQNAPSSGTYLLLPGTRGPAGGLTLFGAVRRESPNMAFYYLRGLAVEMLGALLVTWLLLTLPALGFADRVRVAGALGLAAGVLARLPDWTWWGFSTSFTLTGMADLVISWMLAGLVIAKICTD